MLPGHPTALLVGGIILGNSELFLGVTQLAKQLFPLSQILVQSTGTRKQPMSSHVLASVEEARASSAKMCYQILQHSYKIMCSHRKIRPYCG